MNTMNISGNVQILLVTIEPKKAYTDEEWADILSHVAIAAGLRPLGCSSQNYLPHGETVTVYLQESHIVASTYPEHNLVEIELVSCKLFDGTKVADSLALHGTIIGQTLLLKSTENKWSAF